MVFGWFSARPRRPDADNRSASATPVRDSGAEYAISGMVAPPGLGPRDAEPAAASLEQAQQLLAPLKWCPRLDTAATPNVLGILRDAVDLAGLCRQADGVGPPSAEQIQQLMDFPDSKQDLCQQLSDCLLTEFWEANTRLYYLLRPVIALRGPHAAYDAAEIERLTVVGQYHDPSSAVVSGLIWVVL